MNKKVVKSYKVFLNEGAAEQKKMDELLDILSRRKLTEDERELLVHLSQGGSLPEEEKPTLATHKTGGYMFDDEGNVITEDDGEKPGKEFTTTKGKQSGVDKISKKVDVVDARVYRNKDSDERFFYVPTSYETDSGMTSDWIIYRTGGGSKYPLGMFLDTNALKFRYYKTTPANALWKELDYRYDYGMMLDDDLYEDFINFVELYKENQIRNRDILQTIHGRFCSLL